jgi:hypothetical protein
MDFLNKLKKLNFVKNHRILKKEVFGLFFCTCVRKMKLHLGTRLNEKKFKESMENPYHYL